MLAKGLLVSSENQAPHSGQPQSPQSYSSGALPNPSHQAGYPTYSSSLPEGGAPTSSGGGTSAAVKILSALLGIVAATVLSLGAWIIFGGKDSEMSAPEQPQSEEQAQSEQTPQSEPQPAEAKAFPTREQLANMSLSVPIEAVMDGESKILAGSHIKGEDAVSLQFTNNEAILGDAGDKIVIRDALMLTANGTEGLLVNFVRTRSEWPNPVSTLVVYSIDMELRGRLTQGDAEFNSFMPRSNEGSELAVESSEGNGFSLSMTNVPIERPFPCADCASNAYIKVTWSGTTLDLQSYYIDTHGRQFTHVTQADLQAVADAIAERRDDFAGKFFSEGKVPDLLEARPGPPNVENLPTRREISFTSPLVEPCERVYTNGGKLYLNIEDSTEARSILPPNSWLASEAQAGDLFCTITTGFQGNRYPTAYFQVRPLGIDDFVIVALVTPYS